MAEEKKKDLELYKFFNLTRYLEIRKSLHERINFEINDLHNKQS